jgi:hypothetical protein
LAAARRATSNRLSFPARNESPHGRGQFEHFVVGGELEDSRVDRTDDVLQRAKVGRLEQLLHPATVGDDSLGKVV